MEVETFEKILEDVHNDDAKEFSIEKTNCYAYAIGTPTPIRIGDLAGLEEDYSSFQNVKEAFLLDMQAVDLKVDEVPITTVPLFLNNVKKMWLRPNQFLVVLFIKSANKKNILDFHFIRYDEKHGWSEKFRNNNVSFMTDIYKEWPGGFYNPIGAFVISK